MRLHRAAGCTRLHRALIPPLIFFLLGQLAWGQPWAASSGLELVDFWHVDMYSNWTIRYRVRYQLARFNLRTGSTAPALEYRDVFAREAGYVLKLLKARRWSELANITVRTWRSEDWSKPEYVRQRVFQAVSAYLTSIGAAPVYWSSPFAIPRPVEEGGEVDVAERRGVFLDREYFSRYVHLNEVSVDPDSVSFTLDCSFYLYASVYFPYLRRFVEGAPGAEEASKLAKATVYSIWLLHPNGKLSPVEGPIYSLKLRAHGGLKVLSYRLFWMHPWSYTTWPGREELVQELYFLFSEYMSPESPWELSLTAARAEMTGWSLAIRPVGRGWGAVTEVLGPWSKVSASPNAIEVVVAFPWAPGWLEPLNILEKGWEFRAIAGHGDSEALSLLNETLELSSYAANRVLLGGPVGNPESAQLLERMHALCTEQLEYTLGEGSISLSLTLWPLEFATEFSRRGHLHRDYCLIALTGEYTCPYSTRDNPPSQAEVSLLQLFPSFQRCYRRYLLVWGNTRYGTLAGAFWLSQMPWRHFSFPASAIVLEWTDLNRNGKPDLADRYRVVYPNLTCTLQAGRWMTGPGAEAGEQACGGG